MAASEKLILADGRILYFWYVVESIHKFITEPHVQPCLFVRSVTSRKFIFLGRVPLLEMAVQDYFKFHKRRDFFISYDNQVLFGIILQCGFHSCILQFSQDENIPHCKKYCNFIWFPGSKFLWKGTISAKFQAGEIVLHQEIRWNYGIFSQCLDTQLKAERTNLFWKLPGCSLFSRVWIRWWKLL